MHYSTLTLAICFVAYALSEQCRVSRYHHPVVRAFSRKKRIITVFPNYAHIKITVALPKALIIQSPSGYNMVYELSFYYPLQTKLEEWYPKKLRNRFNKPNMPIMSHDMKMPKDHQGMMSHGMEHVMMDHDMKMPKDHQQMMPPVKDHSMIMSHEMEHGMMGHDMLKDHQEIMPPAKDHGMTMPHGMEHGMMDHAIEMPMPMMMSHNLGHHIIPQEMKTPMKPMVMAHDMNIPVDHPMMPHEMSMTIKRPQSMKMPHETNRHSMMSNGIQMPMQYMPQPMKYHVEHTKLPHDINLMMNKPQAMNMLHESEMAMKPMIWPHDMESSMKHNIMPYDMKMPIDSSMMSHEMQVPMTSPEMRMPMTSPEMRMSMTSPETKLPMRSFNEVYFEDGSTKLLSLRRLDHNNGTKLIFAKPPELRKDPWNKQSYHKFRKKQLATISPSYYDSLKWGPKQIKSWSHPLRQHQISPPRINLLGHILHRRERMPVSERRNLFDEREVDLYESNKIFRKNYRAHRERRNIYDYIQRLGFNFGYDLKSCLLRAICESKRYLLPMGYDLIQDLIRIALTPPSDRIVIDEYSKAHYEDNCDKFDKDCPFSILDMALNPK